MKTRLLILFQLFIGSLFAQIGHKEIACNRSGNPLVIKNLPKNICLPEGYKAIAIKFLDFDRDGKQDFVVELDHSKAVSIDSTLVQFYKGTNSGYSFLKELRNIHCRSIRHSLKEEEESEFSRDYAFVFYNQDTIWISGCDIKYCENHAYFIFNKDKQNWFLSYMEFVNYVAMGRTLTHDIYIASAPIAIDKFSPNKLVHGIIDDLPLIKEARLEGYPERGVLYEMESEKKFPFYDTIRINEMRSSKESLIPDSLISEGFLGVKVNNTEEKLIKYLKKGNEWHKLFGSTDVKWGSVMAVMFYSDNESAMFLFLLDKSGFLRNVYKPDVDDMIVLSDDSISIIGKSKTRKRVINDLLLLH